MRFGTWSFPVVVWFGGNYAYDKTSPHGQHIVLTLLPTYASRATQKKIRPRLAADDVNKVIPQSLPDIFGSVSATELDITIVSQMIDEASWKGRSQANEVVKGCNIFPPNTGAGDADLRRPGRKEGEGCLQNATALPGDTIPTIFFSHNPYSRLTSARLELMIVPHAWRASM